MADPVYPRTLVVPKGASSSLWEHFGFETDGEGHKLNEKAVRCKHCDKEVAYSGNTTNLQQHLSRWHPTSAATQSSSAAVMNQSTITAFSTSPVPKMVPGSKRAKKITRALAEFVAKDMRPIALIEGDGFKSFVASLDPSYQIPSRKHLMSVLHDLRDEVREGLQNKVRAANSVAITIDFWSSMAMQSYLGMTVHFVSHEWVLQSYVLQTKQMCESHTARNIADELHLILQGWEITDAKLSAMTHDSARNIVAAVDLLGCKHLPCSGHTLQLAVRHALEIEEVARVLHRCRRLVGHFNHSYVAQGQLEEKQSGLNLPHHKLMQEVTTRWNSSLEMAKRVLEQHPAITAVLLQSKKKSDRDLLISPDEIAQLEQMVDVLEPFAEATTMLSSEKNVSVSCPTHGQSFAKETLADL